LAFQKLGEQVADFTVVINDEDVRHGVHGRYSSVM
jgi:hypothetical protein